MRRHHRGSEVRERRKRTPLRRKRARLIRPATLESTRGCDTTQSPGRPGFCTRFRRIQARRVRFESAFYQATTPAPGFCVRILERVREPIGVTDTQDTLDRVGGDLTLSATLLPFLEAYAGMHSHATSDNFGRPQLLQVLGDTNLGLKGFLPHQADNVFQWAGWLSYGYSTVRVPSESTRPTSRCVHLAHSTLNNRSDPQQRIPLRFHANFGYLFDNSSSIIEDTEKSRGRPMSRIERFGLDINRVDTLFIGIGGEYVKPLCNRSPNGRLTSLPIANKYTCRPALSSLGDNASAMTEDSRQRRPGSALGLRVTPWLRRSQRHIGG